LEATVFDYIIGLPMHPLVIHAVVVLVPLSALVAIAFAVRPTWRHLLRWPVAIGGVVSGVLAFVAAESGEELQRRVSQARAGTTDFDLLAEHVEWGDRAKLLCLIFMVLCLASAWFLRAPDDDEPRRRALEIPLAILLVVSALSALITVGLAGHAGARVTWTGLG
jgi:formate hydrogenlyase subunit 3/multisubunit Na+/H+ antiporter MnhD subunit